MKKNALKIISFSILIFLTISCNFEKKPKYLFFENKRILYPFEGYSTDKDTLPLQKFEFGFYNAKKGKGLINLIVNNLTNGKLKAFTRSNNNSLDYYVINSKDSLLVLLMSPSCCIDPKTNYYFTSATPLDTLKAHNINIKDYSNADNIISPNEVGFGVVSRIEFDEKFEFIKSSNEYLELFIPQQINPMGYDKKLLYIKISELEKIEEFNKSLFINPNNQSDSTTYFKAFEFMNLSSISVYDDSLYIDVKRHVNKTPSESELETNFPKEHPIRKYMDAGIEKLWTKNYRWTKVSSTKDSSYTFYIQKSVQINKSKIKDIKITQAVNNSEYYLFNNLGGYGSMMLADSLQNPSIIFDKYIKSSFAKNEIKNILYPILEKETKNKIPVFDSTVCKKYWNFIKLGIDGFLNADTVWITKELTYKNGVYNERYLTIPIYTPFYLNLEKLNNIVDLNELFIDFNHKKCFNHSLISSCLKSNLVISSANNRNKPIYNLIYPNNIDSVYYSKEVNGYGFITANKTLIQILKPVVEIKN